jgi:hypothetical protein
VGPVFVVMPRIDTQYAFEMVPSEDENPIETIAADGSHPALGIGVRVRRLHWRPDHFDPLGAKNLVEDSAELPVAVVDQQLEPTLLLSQLHDEVAGLLDGPGAVGVTKTLRTAVGETASPRLLSSPAIR